MKRHIWIRIGTLLTNVLKTECDMDEYTFESVLWIRIHVFLGLQDPDPDPLVRGMDPDPALDPDPDPSIIMQIW